MIFIRSMALLQQSSTKRTWQEINLPTLIQMIPHYLMVHTMMLHLKIPMILMILFHPIITHPYLNDTMLPLEILVTLMTLLHLIKVFLILISNQYTLVEDPMRSLLLATVLAL